MRRSFVAVFLLSFFLSLAASASQSISEINRNPNLFIGRTVSLEGEVIKKGKNGNSFVIDGDGILNDQILVIAPSDNEASTAIENVDIRDRVSLSGMVDELTLLDAIREYDVDLGPEFRSQWSTAMPVILIDMNSLLITQLR